MELKPQLYTREHRKFHTMMKHKSEEFWRVAIWLIYVDKNIYIFKSLLNELNKNVLICIPMPNTNFNVLILMEFFMKVGRMCCLYEVLHMWYTYVSVCNMARGGIGFLTRWQLWCRVIWLNRWCSWLRSAWRRPAAWSTRPVPWPVLSRTPP